MLLPKQHKGNGLASSAGSASYLCLPVFLNRLQALPLLQPGPLGLALGLRGMRSAALSCGQNICSGMLFSR